MIYEILPEPLATVTMIVAIDRAVVNNIYV